MSIFEIEMKKELKSLLWFSLAGTLFFSACASENNSANNVSSANEMGVSAETDSVPAEEIALPPERDFAQEAICDLLSKNQYLAALNEAIKAKKISEIYYIAECVLEIAELEKFVDEKYASVPAGEDTCETIDDGNDIARELRYTLARRLMRENLPTRAREYFPAELLPAFDEYVATMTKAYDLNLDELARAKAFWNAAMIVRGNGDALFASFVSAEDLAAREFCSEREAARVRSREGLGDPTIVMRRRAAKLAFFAASLLPNNDERTARILLTAGTWLRARDVENADIFYKLIAIRCPNTSIGKECLNLHWLPSNVPWTREQTWDGVEL